MQFDSEQRRVATGMLAGIISAASALALGVTGFGLNAMPAETGDRLRLLAAAGLIVSIPLFIAIARLAKHRFFSPADIAGAGLSSGTQRAQILQAMLQNTLEQTLLAMLAYCAWAMLAPADWGALPGLAGILFVLGRLLFFLGYQKGAAGRAFGFTLTFYPTIGMLVCMLPFAIIEVGQSLL